MSGFTRGLDPKKAMGIGIDSILNEIGGRIIDEKEYEKWKKWKNIPGTVTMEIPRIGEDKEENVIIVVKKGTYKVLKNHIKCGFGFHEDWLPKGPEIELINILEKLQDNFRKYGTDFFNFPNFQKVTARTIGLDLHLKQIKNETIFVNNMGIHKVNLI